MEDTLPDLIWCQPWAGISKSRKWNACLCGCFAFWNDHITFSFFIVISTKYHNWKKLPSHPFLCCVKSSAIGLTGIGTALASPHVGPYSNYAHGLRSYPTLKALGQIHWIFGEHFTSMNGLLKKGRDVMLLLKSARNLMPVSLQDLSLLMIRFKNHPLLMPHDQMCV